MPEKKQILSPGGSAGSESTSSSSSNNSLIFTPPTVQQISKQAHKTNHAANMANQHTPSFPVNSQKSTSPPPRPPRTPQFNNSGNYISFF